MPVAWLVMGRNTGITFEHIGLLALIMVLVAMLAASAGLVMGCSVGQAHIGLLFSMVLPPMIMFGCAYYSWSSLKSFPILQKPVLINPMVYATHALRSAFSPHLPPIPLPLLIPPL